MSPLVDFVHRDKRPEQPVEGTFYWIESEDRTEIWFSPDSEYDHMVLLNDDRVDELVSAVSSINVSVSNIRSTLNNIRTEILNEIDSRQYLTQDSLDGYAKTEDIPSLDGYAKLEDIPSLNGYAKTEDIPSLNGYAKIEDIPSLDGYAKLEDIPDQRELTEEDYRIIATMVNEKEVPPLEWIEV